jgi:hypothetical protein
MTYARTALVVVLASAASIALAGDVIVGAFSKSDVAQWEERVFQEHTEYLLTDEDGRTVLAAHSKGTASSYYRKMEIDLVATPVLNWSWRVDQVFPDINEREKSGDDYPARIYLVFSPNSSFWKARSLHYVWASNQPVGAEWSNAYASNAQMVVIESGGGQVGQWRSYKRNVRDDFKKYFGDDVEQVHAVAVMTDTEDTQRSAVAYYGDIFFSKD